MPLSLSGSFRFRQTSIVEQTRMLQIYSDEFRTGLSYEWKACWQPFLLDLSGCLVRQKQESPGTSYSVARSIFFNMPYVYDF